MDRTDRLINNRAPKRLMLIFILVLLLSAAVCFLIAGKCADRIVSEQIRAELSVAGGGKFTAAPDEEAVGRGEALLSRYSIDREMSPKLMSSYKTVRNTVFAAIFGITALFSAVWFAAALRELMAVYRDLEKLRNECVEAAYKTNGMINLYGEDLGSVHRISDAAELLVNRINSLSFRLESEQRFLKNFLTDLSHQIKNSLAVVRLNTDMLNELDDLSPQRREKLSDEIQVNLDGMERLVIETIKLAKLDADAVEYKMELFSPAKVCNTAIKRISPLLRRKNITVKTELDESIMLECDKGWLCEAVGNIIKNSADHSECSEITVSLSENPIMVTLALSDNGKGIPQENIPKLFERFAAGSNDATMYSSGLGMSIAQKIVRAHGGEILVYSQPDEGARFEFVFLKM